MRDQLVLIDSHPAWRMDSSTREVGKRGVARARQALKEARSRAIDGAADESDPDDSDQLAPAA